MDNVRVPPEELKMKLGSKKHLHMVISTQLQFYLPPVAYCKLDYLRQLLKKEKKGIKADELVTIVVPKYKELCANKVWPKIKQIPDILCYFPDLKDNEVPDRQFMWNVLNTLRPFTTEELISKAQKNRSVENEDNIDDLIEIAPEFLRKLKNMTMIKNVRGKSAYYLRKSAKLRRERKAPKEFDTAYNLFGQEANALEIKSERDEDEVHLRGRRDAIMEEEKKEDQDRPRVRIIYPDGNEIKYYRSHDHHSM